MSAQDIYRMYERSVQTPDAHSEFFARLYREVNGGREPRRLREDFCGTFTICCEWVKSDPANTAIGLDLDADVLAYGRKKHHARLKPDQKRRIDIRRANVMSVTKPGSDVVVACNFSFFIFREWEELVKYFRFVRRSLVKDGVFILEVGGGPGFTETLKERRRFKKRNGKPWFTYVWDQQKYDPVSGEGKYAIHFTLPDGRKIENAFTYFWRVWTLPEIRKALLEAGFKETHIYWEERDEKDDLTGVYTRHVRGENDHAWVSYVVGCV